MGSRSLLQQEVDEYRDFWRSRLRRLRCKSASAKEIDALRKDQQLDLLPAAYEAFLLVAGRGYGDLWVGTTAFLPDLLGVRHSAEELFAENQVESFLQPRDVVITMHQGYQFLYLSGPGADPPVFRSLEGAVGVQVSESFTSLIEVLLLD